MIIKMIKKKLQGPNHQYKETYQLEETLQLNKNKKHYFVKMLVTKILSWEMVEEVQEMNIWNIFLTVVIIQPKKGHSYLYSCKSFSFISFLDILLWRWYLLRFFLVLYSEMKTWSKILNYLPSFCPRIIALDVLLLWKWGNQVNVCYLLLYSKFLWSNGFSTTLSDSNS